ncbi:bifunctional methylenetetrahydrofolate dehydrogenase/methenyltetrahydrofolate cyclohydrolase FolD [Hyphococcus flavus]|uniref:Bifunctional protein FolD n=1 Tax=Hyphococcus flavus TaxID=1866326 RepID=A0AAE9ZD70_9PROT|nr:bifunctional methylenetetrahydrofolate dehydrogenase/methenyltetrahydrofolate cyclohydrolase FolD [Hyphococcus flavus]WDI30468.1 bifunctional methylenetetrahydrofolate dehydrogenase/methenyltetrahydrofolate cyclohydrolase FolD [Hyphococcus flavus]
MTIIDGKAFALKLREKIAGAVRDIKSSCNIQPALAVVLVGEDPASQVYVRNKGIATEKAGMRSIEHKLAADASEDDVVSLVKKLNADEEVDGILVQLPLPDHISSERVINEIHPDKDVDGLTEANAGRLILGKTGLVPCTPQGSVMLAKSVRDNLSGLNAVVVGRSILVGKPLAMLLLAENCTVTMAHSRTKNLDEVCREADILCAAVGRPRMVEGRWVKEGATVIDVGINRIEEDGKTRLIGDVDFDSAKERAGAITPVPGGVGPMTIACLLRNTVIAAARRRGLGAVEV